MFYLISVWDDLLETVIQTCPGGCLIPLTNESWRSPMMLPEPCFHFHKSQQLREACGGLRIPHNWEWFYISQNYSETHPNVKGRLMFHIFNVFFCVFQSHFPKTKDIIKKVIFQNWNKQKISVSKHGLPHSYVGTNQNKAV